MGTDTEAWGPDWQLERTLADGGVLSLEIPDSDGSWVHLDERTGRLQIWIRPRRGGETDLEALVLRTARAVIVRLVGLRRDLVVEVCEEGLHYLFPRAEYRHGDRSFRLRGPGGEREIRLL